jgi:hypothetical protein
MNALDVYAIPAGTMKRIISTDKDAERSTGKFNRYSERDIIACLPGF